MLKVLTKLVLQHQISCQARFPLMERLVFFPPLVSVQETAFALARDEARLVVQFQFLLCAALLHAFRRLTHYRLPRQHVILQVG